MYGFYQMYYKRRRAAAAAEGGDPCQEEQIQQHHHQILQQRMEASTNVTGRGKKRSLPLRQENWREKALQRRKVADCQIIACLLAAGLSVVIVGLAMLLAAWFFLGREDPLMLIGPVVICCGIMVLLFSVEVCFRRKKILQQADELSSDEEDGEHYIDESLIPYGFGHYPAGSSVQPIEVQSAKVDLGSSQETASSHRRGMEAFAGSVEATPRQKTDPESPDRAADPA